MAAEGPAMMRSSHQTQPGEGAPLLREGPRQLVAVEDPALSQAGGTGNNRRERNQHTRPPLIQSANKVSTATPTLLSVCQEQLTSRGQREGNPHCPNSTAVLETEVPRPIKGPEKTTASVKVKHRSMRGCR